MVVASQVSQRPAALLADQALADLTEVGFQAYQNRNPAVVATVEATAREAWVVSILVT